jgi:hypothetical protein
MKVKINAIIMCWCDDTGIGKPMTVLEHGVFKCKKCKTMVSLLLLDENDNKIEPGSE